MTEPPDSPQRRELVDALDLLEELFELAEDERAARLDALRQSAPRVAEHVESMLVADRGHGLEPASALGSRPSELEPGAVVGSFRILEELGRGGMGTVYLAERADADFEQRVALKVISADLRGSELVRRFQQERRILARLEHSSIARLIDGGFTPDGAPYYVMELVEGERIDRYCDREALTIDRRIELFLEVCDAVAHAHRHLVVHRDLKPSNILVTRDGVPKLLDFGIAKPLDAGETPPPTESSARSAQSRSAQSRSAESRSGELVSSSPPGASPASPERTRTGRLRFTPGYASPEQLRGEPVSTATDVYSLAVVLYELLCGVQPNPAGDDTPPPELAAAIAHRSAAPPSDTFDPSSPSAASRDQRAANRGSTPLKAARRLRGDLDAIVLRALDPDPERRYASAQALAGELLRERSGELVSAREHSVGYRSRRFLRRHRGLLSAVGLVILSLSVGLFFAVRETRKARAESELSRAVSEVLLEALQAPDPSLGASRGRETPVEDLLLGISSKLADAVGEHRPEVEAEIRRTLGQTFLNLGLYQEGTAELERSVELWERAGGFERDERAFRAALLLAIVPTLTTGFDDEVQGSFLAMLERCRASAVCPLDTEVNLHAALGSQYATVGRLAEARDHLEQALALVPGLPPSAEKDYIHPYLLNQLALVAFHGGDLSRSSELAGRVLELATAPLAHRLGALRLQALMRRLRGDPSGSRELLERAASLGAPVLGEGHPQVAELRVAEAQAWLAEGDAARARAVLDPALAALHERLDPDNRRLLEARATEARVLLAEGRLGEAESAFAEVRRDRRGVAETGAEAGVGWDLAEIDSLLGETLWRLGRRQQGRDLMRSAVERMAAELGEDDPRTREARGRLPAI